MATQRIESGRVQMAGVGGVPMQQITPRQIDYTTAANIQARGTSQLAQVIDRMSQNAFQMAGELAKQAAMDDVANSKLTPEQLEMASRGDMSFLKVGSTLNIYEATVRKARSMELAGHFDTEAKGKVIELMTDVEDNRLTAEAAATKINTLTDGFAKSLASVDADAAIKFTAQMGVYSHTVMAEAHKLERKRQADKRNTLLAADFENTKILMEKTFSQGFFIDAEGNTVSSEVLATRQANDFLGKATTIGKGEEYTPKIAEAMRQAKVGAVSEYVGAVDFAVDPMAAISKLDKGDAGKMTQLWASLTFQDKATIRNNLRTLQQDRQTAQTQADQATLKNDAIRVAELTTAFFQTGNANALKELRAISVRNPKAISPEAVFDMPNKRRSGAMSNPAAETTLKIEIMNGLHPTPELARKRAKEMGISEDRFGSGILSFWITRDDSQTRDVERMFMTESKIVPGQNNISQRQNQAYSNLTRKMESLYPQRVEEAQASGKPIPTRMDVAKEIVTSRQTSNQRAIIDRNLQELNDLYGVTGSLKKTGITFDENVNYNEIAQRASALKLSNDDLVRIQKTINIINQKQKELDAQ